jgi:hypothetical protein
MNRTHLEHLIYALLMQAVIGLSSGNWWAGAAFGAAFFLGREHAQAQRAYQLGDFRAFDFRLWSLDARFDLLCPVVGVLVLGWAAQRFGGQ